MNREKRLRKTLIALSVAQAWGIGQVHAATMRVTTGTEDVRNGCTFRNAVAAINSGENSLGCTNVSSNDFGTNDTIEFNVANITLENGQITIEDSHDMDPTTNVDVKINPGGNRVNILRFGASEFGIFEINDSTVSFDNVEITGGKSSEKGGGIYCKSSTIVLNNSSVSDNSTAKGGGGIASTYSTVRLNSSTVSGNRGTFGAGGISSLYGTLNLDSSAVSGNAAGGRGGGIFSFDGVVTLNESAVSGNLSTSNGGGIYNFGMANLNNSTISDNYSSSQGFSRASGGGLFTSASSSAILKNTTVSGNKALGDGGGIASVSDGDITIINSLVIGNAMGAGAGSESEIRSASSGNITASNSLFGNSTGGFNPIANSADNNIVVDLSSTNLDSVLLPLADNGGPTLTHALPSSSPAIGAANNAFCPATDQRGEARDSQCDIGAYEQQDDTHFFVVPLSNGKSVIFGL
ncbi:MAG: hypothetical protein KTR16_06480 [Acidiferrobacterales bacterium]|nr:hypothetical protein [Acidiferrobacterales bacterium]